MKRLIAALAILLPSFAQAQFVQGSQLWVTATEQAVFANRFRVMFELNPRNVLTPGAPRIMNVFVVPSLGVRLFDNAWASFSLTRIEQVDRTRPSENRIWQQFEAFQDGPLFHFFERFRIEERFHEGLTPLSLRLRALVRMGISLGSLDEWRVVLQDEFFFVPLGITGGPLFGVDQNRAQLTLQKRWVFGLSIDLGYMLQTTTAQSFSGFAPQMNHNAVLLLSHALPIGKKKAMDEADAAGERK